MKILTTFTQDYYEMFHRCFIKSLPKDSELIFQYFNYELEDCKGKFGSHDTLYKIPFILNVLETSKENEIIAYFDVDIVILDEDIEKHINELEDSDLHIQWDNPEGGVCLGCMIMKNTQELRDLFKKFLEKSVDWIIQNHGFSLRYFKHLLDETQFQYKVLPLEFYGGQMIHYGIKVDKFYLYHATFEKTINDKFVLLKKLLNNKIINKSQKMKFLILLMYYNRPKMVRTALESMKRLDYDNWELAVVDDGSDENIYEMCKEYIPEDKIKYYRIEDSRANKEIRGNSIHGKFLNRAILKSDADVVIPLCDDDALISTYLTDLNSFFIRNPNCNYAYSNALTFNPEKESPFSVTERRTGFGFHEEPIEPSGVLDSSQVVFRTKCFKQDRIRYPFPQTKDLDAVVFQKAFELYGKCEYIGVYGQYKAIYQGQLGYRSNIFDYKG